MDLETGAKRFEEHEKSLTHRESLEKIAATKPVRQVIVTPSLAVRKGSASVQAQLI